MAMMNTITIKSDKSKGWILTLKTNNGLEINIDTSRSANVSHVKEKACEYLNFAHPHYFGIQYPYNKPKFVGWLNEKKSLKHEIDKNERSLQLAFKFYDPLPENISCEALRHALYIQLRKDIVDGRLTNNENILARLAALCLQIEVGDLKDSNELKRNIFAYTFAPATMNLSIETDSDFYNDVRDAYREYRGKNTIGAELEFIKICESLPFYGVHRFDLMDANKTLQNIGIGRDGVYLLADDTISNIILWRAIKTIVIKNNDVSIHIVHKESLTCRLGNDNLMQKYDIQENVLFEIYNLFPTNVAVYKSQHTLYAQNFYRLLVESYNFYQCKEATKSKNSSDFLIDKTLSQLRKEYGSSCKLEGESTSPQPPKRYTTLHFTSFDENQTTRRKPSVSPHNLDTNNRLSYQMNANVETLEDNSTLNSSKIKDILTRQKNAIKKRCGRKTLLSSSESTARLRSRTITDTAEVRLSLAPDMSNKNKERHSTNIQTLNSNNIDLLTSLNQYSQPPTITDNFNTTLTTRVTINSQMGSSVSKASYMDNRECSSDSSINTFRIETISSIKRPSDISSHLSALSFNEETEFSFMSGLNMSDENKFDKKETDIIYDLMNFQPSSAPKFTNPSDAIDFINSEKTLEEAKILGDVITKIKNNGPAKPYDFPNVPENTEITTKWIQSIGNIPQPQDDIINNGSSSTTKQSIDNDYLKGFELVDSDYNMEQQPNPILEVNKLQPQQTDEYTTNDDVAH